MALAVSDNLIDLTHPLNNGIPTWDGSCGFDSRIATDYGDCVEPNIFRIQRLSCSAGIGTHIDAPAHVIPNGRTIDQLTLSELVTECVVIDVSHEADEGYLITPTTLNLWEKKYGEIPARSLVIFYTGWDGRWKTPDRYRNNHLFPSVHPTTARFLIERGVAGVGTDTLSCDRGDNGFPVHHALLGADKYLIENIANAGLLPATGAKVFALPTNIEGGTEAPLRLVAAV